MKRYVFLLVGLLYSAIALSQQLNNKGREFWLAYSYLFAMRTLTPTKPVMTISITSDVATSYSVEIYGVTVVASGTIAANQVKEIAIPNTYFIDADGLFVNKAIYVTSDKPVTLYSYITYKNMCGATLCLPYNVLGEKYFAMSLKQYSEKKYSNSYITLKLLNFIDSI